MVPWVNFYIVIGSAAATLAGLMFVGISLGTKLITPETERLARGILSPILYHFTQAFLIACAALVPSHSDSRIAWVIVSIAFVRLVTIPMIIKTLRMADDVQHDIERSDWILSVALPLLLNIILIVSGLALTEGLPWSYFGIALSTLGLILLGVVAAWDMILWMATQV